MRAGLMIVRLLAVVLALAGWLTITSVAASTVAVTGAGSTSVQIVLDQWRADIARQGYAINYQGVGSSAGRALFVARDVDFAASEIPFQPDELSQLTSENQSFQYLPDVGMGTALMFNLHSPDGSRVTTLRLDAAAVAGIFTGAIVTWQDPAILRSNPGLQTRETTIHPVIRSDGSGTSANLSLYLANQAPAVWSPFASAQGCPAPCSLWPSFPGSIQQSGSDGVANFIATDAVGSGAIGYVEAGFAFGRGIPVSSLENGSGSFAQPTATNITTALRHATLKPDMTANLVGVYGAPEANAYPLSSYSYLITPTTGFDLAKGAVLGTWINYIVCAGQREAGPLGYAPLPGGLVQDAFDAVDRIPGAPAPPPLDYQHCPNPALAKVDQTIAFSPLADKILGEPPFAITATASSGLPVAFAASGPCSVAGNMVSLSGTGTCAITASQDGDGSFNPAPNVTVSFQVLSPVQFAQRVADAIAGMTLSGGISQDFLSKLGAYSDSIGADESTAGCGQLGALANAVKAQSGKHIPAVDAVLLLTDVIRLAVASGCDVG